MFVRKLLIIITFLLESHIGVENYTQGSFNSAPHISELDWTSLNDIADKKINYIENIFNAIIKNQKTVSLPSLEGSSKILDANNKVLMQHEKRIDQSINNWINLWKNQWKNTKAIAYHHKEMAQTAQLISNSERNITEKNFYKNILELEKSSRVNDEAEIGRADIYQHIFDLEKHCKIAEFLLIIQYFSSKYYCHILLFLTGYEDLDLFDLFNDQNFYQLVDPVMQNLIAMEEKNFFEKLTEKSPHQSIFSSHLTINDKLFYIPSDKKQNLAIFTRNFQIFSANLDAALAKNQLKMFFERHKKVEKFFNSKLFNEFWVHDTIKKLPIFITQNFFNKVDNIVLINNQKLLDFHGFLQNTFYYLDKNLKKIEKRDKKYETQKKNNMDGFLEDETSIKTSGLNKMFLEDLWTQYHHKKFIFGAKNFHFIDEMIYDDNWVKINYLPIKITGADDALAKSLKIIPVSLIHLKSLVKKLQAEKSNEQVIFYKSILSLINHNLNILSCYLLSQIDYEKIILLINQLATSDQGKILKNFIQRIWNMDDFPMEGHLLKKKFIDKFYEQMYRFVSPTGKPFLNSYDLYKEYLFFQTLTHLFFTINTVEFLEKTSKESVKLEKKNIIDNYGYINAMIQWIQIPFRWQFQLIEYKFKIEEAFLKIDNHNKNYSINSKEFFKKINQFIDFFNKLNIDQMAQVIAYKNNNFLYTLNGIALVIESITNLLDKQYIPKSHAEIKEKITEVYAQIKQVGYKNFDVLQKHRALYREYIHHQAMILNKKNPFNACLNFIQLKQDENFLQQDQMGFIYKKFQDGCGTYALKESQQLYDFLKPINKKTEDFFHKNKFLSTEDKEYLWQCLTQITNKTSNFFDGSLLSNVLIINYLNPLHLSKIEVIKDEEKQVFSVLWELEENFAYIAVNILLLNSINFILSKNIINVFDIKYSHDSTHLIEEICKQYELYLTSGDVQVNKTKKKIMDQIIGFNKMKSGSHSYIDFVLNMFQLEKMEDFHGLLGITCKVLTDEIKKYKKKMEKKKTDDGAKKKFYETLLIWFEQAHLLYNFLGAIEEVAIKNLTEDNFKSFKSLDEFMKNLNKKKTLAYNEILENFQKYDSYISKKKDDNLTEQNLKDMDSLETFMNETFDPKEFLIVKQKNEKQPQTWVIEEKNNEKIKIKDMVSMVSDNNNLKKSIEKTKKNKKKLKIMIQNIESPIKPIIELTGNPLEINETNNEPQLKIIMENIEQNMEKTIEPTTEPIIYPTANPLEIFTQAKNKEEKKQYHEETKSMDNNPRKTDSDSDLLIQLKKQMELLKQINENLQSTIDHKDTIINEQKQKMVQQDTIINEQKQTMVQQKQKINQQEATINQHQEIINQKDGTINQKEATINNNKQTMKQQNETIEKNKKTIKSMESTRQKLAKENKSLQQKMKKLDEAEKDNKALQDALKKKEADLSHLNNQNKDLKDALEDKEEELIQLKDETKGLQDVLEEKEADLSHLNNQNKDLKDALEDKEEELFKLNNEIVQLQGQLDYTHENIQELEYNLEELKLEQQQKANEEIIQQQNLFSDENLFQKSIEENFVNLFHNSIMDYSSEHQQKILEAYKNLYIQLNETATDKTILDDMRFIAAFICNDISFIHHIIGIYKFHEGLNKDQKWITFKELIKTIYVIKELMKTELLDVKDSPQILHIGEFYMFIEILKYLYLNGNQSIESFYIYLDAFYKHYDQFQEAYESVCQNQENLCRLIWSYIYGFSINYYKNNCLLLSTEFSLVNTDFR